MTLATTLYRIDFSRNLRRFYQVELHIDLLGDVVVVRRWGRIGKIGQRRVELQADFERAQRRLQELLQRKIRRGYSFCCSEQRPAISR